MSDDRLTEAEIIKQTSDAVAAGGLDTRRAADPSLSPTPGREQAAYRRHLIKHAPCDEVRAELARVDALLASRPVPPAGLTIEDCDALVDEMEPVLSRAIQADGRGIAAPSVRNALRELIPELVARLASGTKAEQ